MTARRIHPKPPRPYTKHGLTPVIARVRLRGFKAIDKRSAAGRYARLFRNDLVSALGGEEELSPQRRKLVEMTARAALILDHIDAWLVEQKSLVNKRNRTLLPIVTQRTQIAEHLARLLDKLGLDRVPKKIPNLTEYVSATYAPPRDGTPRTAVRADEQDEEQP